MAPRFHYLFCLAIALWPHRAYAQPLFHSEQNWTVMIGERKFGLQGIVQNPGQLRFTQLWMGSCMLNVRCPANEVLTLLLPSVDHLPRLCYLIDWQSFRRFP